MTKAKASVKIKEEFKQTVIAFGNSGLPLGKRSESDIIDLGIIARDSGDRSIIKLFEQLPTLAELKHLKMQVVEKIIISSGIEKRNSK